jgi:hypothetical protein
MSLETGVLLTSCAANTLEIRAAVRDNWTEEPNTGVVLVIRNKHVWIISCSLAHGFDGDGHSLAAWNILTIVNNASACIVSVCAGILHCASR